MIPETDIAYAAGLIDGEGSVGLALETKKKPSHSPSHRPFLSVSMTVEDPVRWLHATFGVGSVQYAGPKPPQRGKWTWRVNGPAVREVIDLLMPYLKVKGPVAYLVTCFYEEGLWTARHGKRLSAGEIDRREALRQEFRQANARGC